MKTHRDSFDLYLIGDIHWGAPTCDEDSVLRVIKDAADNAKRRTTRIILMGDYGNVPPKLDKRNVTKDQRRNDALEIYTEIRDMLKPIAKNVVCCLQGNHDYDWIQAENEDYIKWLCIEDKMPDGGYESYIRFKITTLKDNGNRRNVDVLAWHGAGGGRTVGGAFNTGRKPIDVFRTPSIIAMGHLHRLGMVHEQFMEIDENRLDVVDADQYFCLTGGFLKGYQPPDSTYISRKMLPPVAIGAVKLKIQPFHDVGNRDMLDVQFSEVR